MNQGENSPNFRPAGERFATGFEKTTGDVFVFGALLLGSLALGCGLYFGNVNYFIAAIVCALCAFYFFPYTEVKLVQLGADSRGLYVGGLGLIEWNAIEKVEIKRVPVRRVERAELSAILNRPIKDALSVPDKNPWWRDLMARNWSVKSDGRVVVRLEHLKAKPDAVKAELLPFWERR